MCGCVRRVRDVDIKAVAGLTWQKRGAVIVRVEKMDLHGDTRRALQ